MLHLILLSEREMGGEISKTSWKEEFTFLYHYMTERGHFFLHCSWELKVESKQLNQKMPLKSRWSRKQRNTSLEDAQNSALVLESFLFLEVSRFEGTPSLLVNEHFEDALFIHNHDPITCYQWACSKQVFLEHSTNFPAFCCTWSNLFDMCRRYRIQIKQIFTVLAWIYVKKDLQSHSILFLLHSVPTLFRILSVSTSLDGAWESWRLQITRWSHRVS